MSVKIINNIIRKPLVSFYIIVYGTPSTGSFVKQPTLTDSARSITNCLIKTPYKMTSYVQIF